MIVIYMLHFDEPVGRALHYVGSSTTITFNARIRAHQFGNGANLTRRAFERNIDFKIARLWLVPDRTAERTMKNTGHFRNRCPICRPSLGMSPIAKPPGCEPRGLDRGPGLDLLCSPGTAK